MRDGSSVKLRRFRATVSCPGMFGIYIDHLLRGGLHGDTRAEVIRNILGRGLMEAIPGETIRKLVEKHKGKPRYPHEQ